MGRPPWHSSVYQTSKASKTTKISKRAFAAKMRKNPSWPEKILWSRMRKISWPTTVLRQRVTQGYIIDFAFPTIKLGVEVDGKDFHDPVKDKIRDGHLADAGWTIIRFTASEVNTRPMVVVEKILMAVEAMLKST